LSRVYFLRINIACPWRGHDTDEDVFWLYTVICQDFWPMAKLNMRTGFWFALFCFDLIIFRVSSRPISIPVPSAWAPMYSAVNSVRSPSINSQSFLNKVNEQWVIVGVAFVDLFGRELGLDIFFSFPFFLWWSTDMTRTRSI
jgi:hypothetical protein